MTALVFRQHQLACLSLNSYLVGDATTGRAVVVDPQRDVQGYLREADLLGLRIERVIETHFHADFVSGHLELAAATGAAISFGDRASADFAFEPLADGQRLSLGEVELEIRHTPGHTPESISIVVREHAGGEPWGVLTGDTLFIGDVGRPDLLAAAGVSADAMARDLYRSLHTQLLTLPDATRVFPAHGAGSACGKHMSAATESTIGEQRAGNYALAPMSEDAFVQAVTEGQTTPPLYFASAATTNRHDHGLLDTAPPPALTLDQVLRAVADGAVVLDTRAPEVFASGHLVGSVNVGLDGRFAEYAGEVIDPGTAIVIVTEPGAEAEARMRLGRIGFDAVAGWLPEVDRALAEHPDLARTAARLPAEELAAFADDGRLQLLDVRAPSEREAGSAPGSIAIPLPELTARIGELDPSAPTVVYCAGGYRSSIAASYLRAHGFTEVADVLGGWTALSALSPA